MTAKQADNRKRQRGERVDDVLGAMTQRLVDAFDPQKIVLFGSRAHGDGRAGSDIDLLVVMETDERPVDRYRRVAPVARVPGVPMDILVRTPAEIDGRLAMGDHFIREILTGGRVLHERVAG